MGFLKAEAPYSASPAYIAKSLSLEPKKVRVYLGRMMKRGDVERVGRGLYRAVEGVLVRRGVPYKDLRLENLVIVSNATPATVRRYVAGVAEPSLRYDGHFHCTRVDRPFMDRLIHVQAFDNGTLHVQLGTKGSASGKGLSFMEFSRFTGWMEAEFSLPLGAWLLKSYELNADLIGLRIDGAKSFTLRIFHDLWLKLYEKTSSTLRMEVRHKRALRLDDVTKWAMELAQKMLDEEAVEVVP